MVAAHAGLEVAAADIDDMPRPEGPVAQGRAVGGVGGFVDASGLVDAAARIETVAPPVIRVLRIHEEVRSEDVIVLDLEQAVDAGEGAEVGRVAALIEEDRVRLVSRVSGRAPEFLLLSVEIRSGNHVARAGLPVELGVVVVEKGPVLGLADSDDLDVVPAERAPEPQLVLHQRSADVETPVQNPVDAVGGLVRVFGHVDARVGLEAVGDVVRLELVAAEVRPRGGVERVRAALGDEIQANSAGHHREIVAAGVDLDLIEGVEVVVRGRAAATSGVGDDDTVVGVDGVSVGRALGREHGLLPSFVAGDGDPVDQDAGDGLEHGPGVSGLGGLRELIVGQRGGGSHSLDVDDRRFRGHVDGFGE